MTSVNFTNDGQCLLVSSLDNSIRLVDKDSGAVLNTFTGHSNKEYKLDSFVSCKDTFVMSGSEEGDIYFWDLIQAKVIHKIESAHEGTVYSMTRHTSKDIIITASTGCVKVWMNLEDSNEHSN